MSNAEIRRSPYFVFFVKMLIATGVVSLGVLATLHVSMLLVLGSVNSMGGRAFWKEAERRLYSVADEPDIEPQKKAKIIAAIKKLADKNRPFVDALVGK